MKSTDSPDRRIHAIAAALSLNRGELDPAKLAQLLRALEAAGKAAAA
jgi:hypothetical protein